MSEIDSTSHESSPGEMEFKAIDNKVVKWLIMAMLEIRDKGQSAATIRRFEDQFRHTCEALERGQIYVFANIRSEALTISRMETLTISFRVSANQGIED